jgi:RNA polymerase sigma factor (sigma-70 family)
MAAITLEQLQQLLDGHAAALVLYARQWCDTPEDVVQDALVQLMAEPAAPQNPVAWLYRTVRNRAINAGRARRRRAAHEAQAAMQARSWFVPAACDRLDAAAATEALAALPLELREVIVARLWGALPLEEIARLAGTSVSTAHRRYQQGIAALRERLEGICPKQRTEPTS